jgi:serine phosphatase RsbU (regulator of sigma subunit)/anti-sigma regulatory factor (Ser/Thr protein kinase)
MPVQTAAVLSESAMLTLLARVSRVLASSLDYRATLREVADSLVPDLADACEIVLGEDNPETVAAAGDERLARALPPSRVFSAGAGTGLPEPVRGRIPIGKRAGRYLDVPVAARQHLFGVLRLAKAGNGEDEEQGLTLAEEVALRIALAVDAAHVHAREHRVADTLQRALLPEDLPIAPSYAYHAAYAPAMADEILGGDWYDAFPLPDGRVALSIGDVAGHGLHAATIMGEVRQALRASALEPKSPSAVLERANALINMRSRPVMVTSIFGIYDPLTRLLTYATAGHPAPVLGMRDGWVAALPAAGLPLGIGAELDSHDWTFTLPAGSLVSFYTDGLIEHTRDLLAGEASVLDAIAAEIISPSENPALTLQQRIFTNGRNSDDVATLTLSLRNELVGSSLEMTCSAIPLAAPLVRHTLLDYAKRNDISEATRFELVTTIGEAIANSAEHAYVGLPGLVHVSVRLEAEMLHVGVEDHGRWKPTARREERGRGLRLMRALSTGLQIRSDASGTVIHLSIPVVREGAAV